MKALKPYLFPIALTAALFISFGDKVFPEPLKGASYQSRTAINQFVIGLMPGPHAKVDPNKRTEDAVQELEQKQKQ